MCTIGIDGNLPASSFGWQGKNASPSIRCFQDDPLVTGESSQTDSYLLNAKLLLHDDFEELEIHSRLFMASVKLFLTDTHIIVAKLVEDILSDQKQVSYLRTHNINEVDIELDKADNTMVYLTTQSGQRFLYRIKDGAARVASWVNRVFRMRRSTISPFTPTESTVEERGNQLPPSSSVPSFVQLHHQEQPAMIVAEGDNDHEQYTVSESSQPHGHGQPTSSSNPNGSLISSNDTSIDDEIEITSILRKGSAGLKRRKAFRNSDLGSFRGRTRSSSVPVEEIDPDETRLSLELSSISNNGLLLHDDDDDDETLNSTNAFESPSRHSSLRKGKLKISPRANKFARALSARLSHTSNTVNGSVSPPNSEVRRAKSLNSTSTTSTLPRSKRSNKNNRAKAKSTIFDTSTPPVTPTRTPKSPGSILKRFNRMAGGSSTFNLEEFLSSMEDNDISMVDVQNKPKQLKLHLQPPKQIAEELTLIDVEIFREIEQCELENGAWTKKTKHSTSPNVLKMIESFNRLARIVCTEIVHEKTASARGKAISNYIKIVSELLKLLNYNSVKAIVSGLQSQAVYRLKRSWSHVPSRRRKKFDKYSDFLSKLDSIDGFKEHMLHNIDNNVQCIPYLGWLLTYTLHHQTFKKLQSEREVVPLRHHRTSSVSFPNSPRKAFRESVCSLSLPNSPMESEDEAEEVVKSVITNFSAEVLHFTKSFSDTNVHNYFKDSSPRNGSSSPQPQDEVDYGLFPPSIHEKYANQLHPLHPLAGKVIVNPVIFSSDNDHQESSSDTSSVEESVQTDSAIGLDSSTGHPSPAHNREHDDTAVVHRQQHQQRLQEPYICHDNPDSAALTPRFSGVVEHIDPPPPSCDLIIHYDEADNDSSNYEYERELFDGSYIQTPPAAHRSSSSHSNSILSLSMVKFIIDHESPLIATPPKVHFISNRSPRFMSVSCQQHESSSAPLCLPSCGVIFGGSFHSEDRFDAVQASYNEPGVSFEEIVERIRKSFETFDSKPSVKGDHSLMITDFGALSTSTLNLDTDSSDNKINPPMSSSLTNDHQEKKNTAEDQVQPTSSAATIPGPSVEDSDVSVFMKYQRNTLNYSSELTSRQHMRYLISNIPWLDENQCHQVSLETEPPSS